jgi:hypothetical protein
MKQKNWLKTNRIYLVTILFVFIFFLYRGISFLDPDFGWHLMTGKIILTSGISKTDPFSYTMPSFPFINHEWLNDVIIAKLFPVVGWFGLSFLFAVLAILTIVICINKDLPWVLKAILFIFGISVIEPTFAVSPRVFSWLFLSLTAYIVLNKELWQKYWWLTLLIILLWANLHGSFPLGILILGAVFIIRTFASHKFQIKEFLATILGFAVSFINPYGSKLWWLVWLTISDSSIKSRIAEWQPTLTSPTGLSFLLFFLVALSVVLIYRYRRKFSSEELIINVFFFIFALTAIRNVPFWVIVDLPMVGKGLTHLSKDLEKIQNAKKKFLKVSYAVFVLSSAFLIFQFGYTFYHISTYFNETGFYPSGAVKYLSVHIPSGQIFSSYDWGGYLVWKLPQKKVFIDGIMPVWKFPAEPPGESKDAMDDYMNLTSGKVDHKPLFNKFDIDTVLLAKPLQENGMVALLEKDFPFLEKFGMFDNTFDLRNELVRDNWKIVYQDQTAIIYQK